MTFKDNAAIGTGAASGALVRGDSVVEFRVISDPGKQGPHANSMDRRTGGNGSMPRMEPEKRASARTGAQRDTELLREGQAGDPAHAARRTAATGRCLRLCWLLTSISIRTPGCPLTSTCGKAHGADRGQRARGSKRGL